MDLVLETFFIEIALMFTLLSPIFSLFLCEANSKSYYTSSSFSIFDSIFLHKQLLEDFFPATDQNFLVEPSKSVTAEIESIGNG